MKTEQPTSDQSFIAVDALHLSYSGVVCRVAYVDGPQMVTIEDADFDVAKARELRDWLNKVIP